MACSSPYAPQASRQAQGAWWPIAPGVPSDGAGMQGSSGTDMTPVSWVGSLQACCLGD